MTPTQRRGPGWHPGLYHRHVSSRLGIRELGSGPQRRRPHSTSTRAPRRSAARICSSAGLEAGARIRRSAFRYTEEELAFLARIRDYEPRSSTSWRRLRFTGDIARMPEGTIAFPNEPLLRVTAPFREAILLESGLLQAINLATLIATKAARIVWAAQRRRVVGVRVPPRAESAGRGALVLSSAAAPAPRCWPPPSTIGCWRPAPSRTR